MTNLPSLKTTVRGAMARRRSRRSNEIAISLFLLTHHRKPSVLLDFCEFAHSGLDRVCVDVLGQDGIILSLDLDHFIANKHNLVAHLDAVLEHPPVFLDVSGSNTQARLCGEKVTCEILDSVRALRCRIVTSEGLVICQERVEGWNLATLFGVLLGYPVVYWFSSQQDENCLSGQDLAVYSVVCEGSTPVSFTIPTSALHLPEVTSSLDSWLCTTWPEVGACPWNHQFDLDGVQLTFSCSTVNKPSVVL